ncbi:transcriptional regulator [Legionella lansingensis]|uniref:LysR family transporter transcriptional regulator n=1 Tax=Legionella lansingensis TaxID=45067 RepID=A0A0W0VG39_9GAMM|nr:LysR family transcriptional regulator [Legionella lansingensis]KTD19141.1 LysR family transporter transcriptional regulator [Legionella lansingensis]SNV45524.1 transcriptional regulator [Legionella lansingensis]
MDIRDIKSFFAVIEYRSITLAAKKMHVTQSAMSKRIQKIENELGVRLLIMEGSKIILTEAAKHLIPHARQMLSAHQNMIQTLKKTQEFSQHAVIGASVYVSHYVLPGFLKYLKEKNALIQAHIKAMSELEVGNYLNHGIVDVVICPAREIPEKLITPVFLWEEKLNLVVGANHELALRHSSISLSQLADYPAILTEKGGAFRDKIEGLFEEHHLSLKLGFEISTIDAIRSLVEYDLGWSFLPDSLLSEKLKVPKVRDIEVVIPFCAYYLKKRADERLIHDLLSHFTRWQNPNEKEEKIMW